MNSEFIIFTSNCKPNITFILLLEEIVYLYPVILARVRMGGPRSASQRPPSPHRTGSQPNSRST